MITFSPRSFSYLIAAAFLLFFAGSYAMGWTPPASAPPAGNVSAPINVSNTGQTKSGGVILNTGGATYGLIVDQGKVGIGTTNPAEKLDIVGGNIKSDTGFCIGSACITSWPAGGGGSAALKGTTCQASGTNTCTLNVSCPAGGTITSVGESIWIGTTGGNTYDRLATLAHSTLGYMSPTHSCVGSGSCNNSTTQATGGNSLVQGLMVIACSQSASQFSAIPTGLYGSCNEFNRDTAPHVRCTVPKAPAYCTSSDSNFDYNYCLCPSGYGLAKTGESNESFPNRYRVYYSCYKN